MSQAPASAPRPRSPGSANFLRRVAGRLQAFERRQGLVPRRRRGGRASSVRPAA